MIYLPRPCKGLGSSAKLCGYYYDRLLIVLAAHSAIHTRVSVSLLRLLILLSMLAFHHPVVVARKPCDKSIIERFETPEQQLAPRHIAVNIAFTPGFDLGEVRCADVSHHLDQRKAVHLEY